MGFNLTDIVSISDFRKQDIDFVLEKAAEMEKMPAERKSKILEHKVVASLFFEPSTRTRLSFETAIQNLGAEVIGFADKVCAERQPFEGKMLLLRKNNERTGCLQGNEVKK